MPKAPVDLSETLQQAMASYQAGRLDRAEALCGAIIDIKPSHFAAVHLLAVIQSRLGRSDEALVNYDKALAIAPDDAMALNNRGNVLGDLGRFEDALASYDRALAIKPDYADALSHRGVALRRLGRFKDALTSFDEALAINPGDAGALTNRGNALQDMNRLDEALADYDKAIALKPDNAEALYNRGNALQRLRRLDEALASYERALAIKPDHRYAFGRMLQCVNKACDWPRRTKLADGIAAHIAENKSIISPFTLLGCCDDPLLQLQCARNYLADMMRSPPRPLWSGARWRHHKVRIAYLSADFHQHATAYMMAELFERHDRSRFEVTAVSLGVDDRSAMRRRLIAAFDRFHDARGASDRDIARLLHDLQVDIAISLNWYTQESRAGILMHRPAPIQISFPGFSGTTGAAFIDYLIADRTVAPFEHEAFYAEKLVHLPDSYQVNDSRRAIAERAPTRQEAGLPEQGFVFCCFNNNWKITPEVFGVWMRLLHAVEGSVLWLLRDNAVAERNLCRQAQTRGIDPARLVFAGRMTLEDHLARHRLADLFLDTLPYNAHATASDALWAGLPVATQLGEAFAGRVAASALHAVGLPELVTHSSADYEALALRLARDREALAGIKAKLARNRTTCPLFDTDRFRRHIEAAYVTMWELWQNGEEPRSFAVEPARE